MPIRRGSWAIAVGIIVVAPPRPCAKVSRRARPARHLVARGRRPPRSRRRSAAGAALMCGIAGALDRSGGPIPTALLRRMSDVIAHRGPDGEGQYCRRPGRPREPAPRDHRPRARGRPADGDATASYVITYNGEIYNFRELRAELERRGPPLPRRHRHRGRAERVRAVGRRPASSASTACSPSRSGIARARELFLARDRYGIKPLYYAEVGPMVAVRLRDQGAARACRRSQRAAEPAAPARVLHLPEHLHRRHAVRRRQPAAPRPRIADRGETRAGRAAALLGLHLRRARRAASDERVPRGARPALPAGRHRQLVADVPVGAHLSGGMDSGSHHRVAASALPYLNTFTVGFDMTLAPRASSSDSTSARRPRRCRTASVPSTTRRC